MPTATTTHDPGWVPVLYWTEPRRATKKAIYTTIHGAMSHAGRSVGPLWVPKSALKFSCTGSYWDGGAREYAHPRYQVKSWFYRKCFGNEPAAI